MDGFELVNSPPPQSDSNVKRTATPLEESPPQVDLDELSLSLQRSLLPARSVAFRVLFLGHRISQRQKSVVLKKIGQGIAAIPALGETNRRIPDGAPRHFRERTHNVIILDAFNLEPVETYEDNGLHVIEADFMWSDPKMAADENEELDAFINYHYGPKSSSSASENDSSMNHKGIDLVIYLFSAASAVYDKAVERDMRALARLSALGVYTWPILAGRLSRSQEHHRLPGSNNSSRPQTRNSSFRRAASPTSATPTPSSSFLARGRVLSGGGFENSISELSFRQEHENHYCELTALQMALSAQLSKYPIKTADISGINPERPRFAAAAAAAAVEATTSLAVPASSVDSPEESAATVFLTIEQFANIDQADMYRILNTCKSYDDGAATERQPPPPSSWPLKTIFTSLIGDSFSRRAMMYLLLATVLASSSCIRKTTQPPETCVAHPTLQQAIVKLDPMWEVPDEYSLRHFFVVELVPTVQLSSKNTLWSNEDIKVTVNSSSTINQRYGMSYIPGTQFKYSADVPSPCLLNSNEDFTATVEWTLYHSSTVVNVAQVKLYLDICKSVDQGRTDQDYTPAQFANTKKRMVLYTPPSWYQEQWVKLLYHVKQYFKELRKHLKRYL